MLASLETDECSKGMWFGLLKFISFLLASTVLTKLCVYLSHSSTLETSKCGETLASFPGHKQHSLFTAPGNKASVSPHLLFSGLLWCITTTQSSIASVLL